MGALAVAAAMALAGCGDKADPQVDAASGTGSASVSDATAGASDAVAAVQSSAGAAVARLSFVIDARPVAGQPFALKLLVSAAEPMSALQLSVDSTTLVATPASAVVALEGANEPATVDVVVTPPKEGLAELSVSLKVPESAAETVYVIPVLVASAG